MVDPNNNPTRKTNAVQARNLSRYFHPCRLSEPEAVNTLATLQEITARGAKVLLVINQEGGDQAAEVPSKWYFNASVAKVCPILAVPNRSDSTKMPKHETEPSEKLTRIQLLEGTFAKALTIRSGLS